MVERRDEQGEKEVWGGREGGGERNSEVGEEGKGRRESKGELRYTEHEQKCTLK